MSLTDEQKYKNKYLKYKNKYTNLKEYQQGGGVGNKALIFASDDVLKILYDNSSSKYHVCSVYNDNYHIYHNREINLYTLIEILKNNNTYISFLNNTTNDIHYIDEQTKLDDLINNNKIKFFNNIFNNTNYEKDIIKIKNVYECNKETKIYYLIQPNQHEQSNGDPEPTNNFINYKSELVDKIINNFSIKYNNELIKNVTELNKQKIKQQLNKSYAYIEINGINVFIVFNILLSKEIMDKRIINMLNNDANIDIFTRKLSLLDQFFYHKNYKADINIKDNNKIYTFDEKTLTLTINDNINKINTYDIKDIPIIKELIIPKSVTYIGPSAFSRKQIEEITFNKFSKLETIGDMAFYRNNIKNLIIPSNVKAIGNYTFYNNNITILTIPDNLINIGCFGFSNNIINQINIKSFKPGYHKLAFYTINTYKISLSKNITFPILNDDIDTIIKLYFRYYYKTNKNTITLNIEDYAKKF